MPTQTTFNTLPDEALIRKQQLVAEPGSGALSLLPFSGTTLWRKVREGTFPAPRKVSGNMTAWRVGDVRAWMLAHGK